MCSLGCAQNHFPAVNSNDSLFVLHLENDVVLLHENHFPAVNSNDTRFVLPLANDVVLLGLMSEKVTIGPQAYSFIFKIEIRYLGII